MARPGPLRQPTFRRFLVGLAADLVGDQIWFIALALAAIQAADPATAGLVVAAGTVPRMLLLIGAGGLVDRLGALRVAQAAQLARVVIMVAALVVMLHAPTNLPTLFVLAVTFGIADAARLPAAGALPATMLPADQLPQSQGLVSTTGRLATIAGGPATSATLAVGGLPFAVATNIALLAVAFVSFAFIGPTRPQATVTDQTEPSPRAGVIAGLVYVGRDHDLRFMLMLLAILNLAFVGPLNIGLVLRLRQQDWPPEALGLILGAFGVAAAAGSLSLTRWRPHYRPVLIGFAGTATSGAAIALLGSAPTVPTTMTVAAVAGLGLGPASSLLVGYIQATTNPQFIGRVMGLVSFTSFGLAPISLSGFGFLSDLVNVPNTFVIYGSAAIIIAILGMLKPNLRTLTLANAREPTK